MPGASGWSDATNSSLLPASVLKAASTHAHPALPSGFEPSGPNPS
jgi:hypothetical protein